jgi:tRNA threonylcarbamoyladenosine biosynthesis protein TsaB
MSSAALTLFIDTAGNTCAVGLVRSGEVIASLREPMTRGHDAALAPLVDAVFRSAALAPRAVSRIGVNVGPGSFTGVRVGVAFARGLSLATGAVALGVSSLETLPPDLAGPHDRYIALLPAKRRPPELSWWAQGFDGAGNPLTGAEEVDLIGLHDLAHRLGARHVLTDTPSGPEGLDPSLKLSFTRASADRIGLIAAQAEPSLRPPRPIYVRAPDAVPMKPRNDG